MTSIQSWRLELVGTDDCGKGILQQIGEWIYCPFFLLRQLITQSYSRAFYLLRNCSTPPPPTMSSYLHAKYDAPIHIATDLIPMENELTVSFILLVFLAMKFDYRVFLGGVYLLAWVASFSMVWFVFTVAPASVKLLLEITGVKFLFAEVMRSTKLALLSGLF